MTRRMLAASMVMAAAFCTTSAAVASPFHSHKTVNAAPKIKQVKLNFRNDAKNTIKVTVGGVELTVAPGETKEAKLNPGDKIVAGEGSSQAEGTVLAVGAPQLQDATVVLR